MAKNVSLWGTDYSAVPALDVPQTGGGTARFTDTSPTTATDPDVLSGKIYFKADGTQSTGTGSGGGTPTLETVTKTYTPSTSAVTDTITPSSGYDGIEEVDVTVSAVPLLGNYTLGNGYRFITENGQRKFQVDANLSNMADPSDGYIHLNRYETITGNPTIFDAIATGTTVAPTESSQTIGGYRCMMESAVTVNAIPSNYVGSGITQRTSSDLSASGATVTAPSGYYASSATKTVASGTEGTPTATKSAVSNHALTVTPSVTNSAGYISGGTHNGTAVSVSASELVSGTLIINSSGTADVTNLASVSVSSQTLPIAVSSSTVGTYKANISPNVGSSSANKYLNIPTGFNDTAQYYVLPPVSIDSLQVTQNGTYDCEDYGLNGFGIVTVNVSGGGGQVAVNYANSTLETHSSELAFSSLLGEPTSFSFFCTTGASVPTSNESDRIIFGVFDGDTSIQYGKAEALTPTNGSQVNTAAFEYTYSSATGTVTLYAIGCDFAAGTYVMLYSYNGSSANVHTQDVQVGSGATSITFTGLDDEPIYWSCIFKSSFSTSSGYQRVIGTAYFDEDLGGLAMDSSAHWYDSSWTWSYNNGSLTITSVGTNNGGYFHQPGYYQLTYVLADASPYQKINKTYSATTTTQTEKIEASSGYDAIGEVNVTVNPISQTNLIAANIKNGTTVTINNGTTNIYSVTGSYTGGGGGSATVATTTWTNSDSTATSHTFSSLSGTPIAAFLRCTTSLSRSSSSTNYFVADMLWTGSACRGNSFRRSNGTYANVTNGYSATTGTNSITFTSSGTSTSNPGSFYNGTYELTYIY